MLRTKPDVRFEVITPELLYMLRALEAISHKRNFFIPTEGIVITSGTEGKHMEGSLHYKGRALDIRSKTFKTRESKFQFIAAVRNWLGNAYDMILESEGQPNEHFHLEYDPRP